MVRVFHYLSLLNLIDAFVTYYGLEKALITEMNPIMDKIYHLHPALFVLTKVSLSLFLYLFIVFKRVPASRLIKGIAFTASFLYTIVFGLHCWWLILTI
ncbi:hypothetical protein SAMN05192533_10786 [Mesobacillus persicus]|uniref:DUF5658 domain-containing protein n=1 Tax=Mesobacillus persicus TaxID=930146 RepID=A0A1H8CH50_9BACI|nr:DUF5658 family protein [Mesobacillus persicus]SEM94385.1 hypothetical protein SAMN05192533_10786 [Mesobacillus persicus]